MSKKKQMNHRKGGSVTETKTDDVDFKGRKMDIKSIMKDIEFLGSSHMTWKDRKDLENRKVVALGGKPPKNQRLPLSVARVTMKKQKERDQKLQEEMVLGRFRGMLGNGSNRATEKRRPENKVLKSTEGYFRNGVLNVKNLLKPGATRELDRSINTLSAGFDNPGKKKGSFGKKKGKKKGGGKKRR
ncbi:hypothetical protein RHGRI_020879 [Rhododendron griersonianum]|uniref:Axoneme-associated protein MST101(2) protein n=1 Tax=Rhododendron griersonianum TaxID=479676 RepID=A0AAV6JI69_9ERIC|nr:hypothetical protein RHGRI_020879 [Rhododendron griersonianum]